MLKLRPAKPREVERILKRLGFQRKHQVGSHIVFQHPSGRRTTLVMHAGRDIPTGTLRNIIKDIGVKVEEFESMR